MFSTFCMKKAAIFTFLSFALVINAKAQYANATGDVVIPGSNAWTLHTPDDGRTTLYVAPWGTDERDWLWSRQTEFSKNGDVRFSGNIKIGRNIPTNHPNYRLAVEGKLVCQSLYITAPTSWADFVFADRHKYLSLPKLESYLLRNKHLPAIPSAEEITSNGYNVTEMDAKLLQSVEELTLHVISLNKEMVAMRKENIRMKAKIHALQRDHLQKK